MRINYTSLQETIMNSKCVNAKQSKAIQKYTMQYKSKNKVIHDNHHSTELRKIVNPFTTRGTVKKDF